MQPDIKEALRYLGVRSDADGSLHVQMTALSGELTTRITPRWTWRMLPVNHSGDALLLDRLPLPGRSAEKILAECDQCALLVCTLGTAFDAWLRQAQARDMVCAVMLDALGSAYVEAACDAAEQEIAARFPAKHLTDRFSPGYGDLPLELQPQLLEMAEARRLGVYTTPTCLMNPVKSVTALIGLAGKPQMARIRGCSHCSMNQTCTMRKAGKTCEI